MNKQKLGVVMDPIAHINVAKDTTLALLLEAQKRGYEIHYFELSDLMLENGVAYGLSHRLSVRDDQHDWFTLEAPQKTALGEFDILLMRKDPPFDAEYIYATYILERAQAAGARVVNNPQSLRDANEKLFTAWFAQCTPPTLVSRNHELLLAFLDEHNEVVFKPPEGMGGSRVFYVKKGDLNTNVILETLTLHQSHYIIAQRFIPEIARGGDKRILMINGKPVPYALARIPHEGDLRGNLAAGASYEGRELTARDKWICEQVGPTLREKGLLFVGLDVIGDYLTEINVTSPTCVRQLDHIYNLNIASLLFDEFEKE